MLTKLSLVECTPKMQRAGLCTLDAAPRPAEPVIVTDPGGGWMPPPDFLELLQRLGVEVQDGVLYVTELRIALWSALLDGQGRLSAKDVKQIAAGLAGLAKALKARAGKEVRGSKGSPLASRQRQNTLRYAAAIETLASMAGRVRVTSRLASIAV
ncbi:MAG: hypothetical protein Q8P18_29630 [Pseudomonadota bacterium]|nr:hypothetical protein [Pseudomonadota bacterium]